MSWCSVGAKECWVCKTHTLLQIAMNSFKRRSGSKPLISAQYISLLFLFTEMLSQQIKSMKLQQCTDSSWYLPSILGRHPFINCFQLFAWHISTVLSALLEIGKLKFSSVTGWVRSCCGQPSTGTDIGCPVSSKPSPTVPEEVCCPPWVHFWRPSVGRAQLHPRLRWESCSKWFWGFVKKQNRKSAWIWSLTIIF